MNKEIEVLAEKEYPYVKGNDSLHIDRHDVIDVERAAFIKGAELSIGFLVWYIENGCKTLWYEQIEYNDGTYTTQELFNIYLQTLTPQH